MRHAKLALITLIVLTTLGVHSISAQQKMYTVGYLTYWIDDFKAEMTKLGYVEGQNVTIKALNLANVKPEDWAAAIQTQTQQIVASQPDVIVTNTDSDAAALLKQTGNIPVVFTISDDPVATGAVKSLLHPGGTATGAVSDNPNARRLQLMSQIKPSTKQVYYMYNNSYSDSDTRLSQVQASAKQLNIEVVLAPVSDIPTADAALKKVPDDIDWIYITPFVFFDDAGNQALLDLSLTRHIAVSGYSDNAFQYWTFGYGPNLDVVAKQSADNTDRILRGASPSDIPVLIADNFLMINLDTAQAMQLQVPETILRQATTIVHPGDFAKTPTAVPATQAAN